MTSPNEWKILQCDEKTPNKHSCSISPADETNALPRLYLHGGSNHWGFVRLPKVVPSYRGRDKETIASLLAVFCCNLDQQMHTIVHSSGRRYLRGIRKWIKWHSDSCRETDSLLIVIIDQQRNVKKVMPFKAILTLTNYYSPTEVQMYNDLLHN